MSTGCHRLAILDRLSSTGCLRPAVFDRLLLLFLTISVMVMVTITIGPDSGLSFSCILR
tara:strand:- start:111 stop:287 length:177 start_codon:yes stop_codon:yes gene_type:complete